MTPSPACPFCSEDRLVERIGRLVWFCAVCAHLWVADEEAAR